MVMALSNIIGIMSGGSSGLGAATVRYLVRNGGRVVVADLPNQRERFLQSVLTSDVDESQIIFSETDVQSSDQISKALDLAETTFGEPANADISCTCVCPAKVILSTKRGSTEGPRAHTLDLLSSSL
jgi:3-hydroxyacyl-CoA dehydrogenase/3-hydroxy-2-methylbutyryl-CoA dehydrogenase